jgi:hypothetical protein
VSIPGFTAEASLSRTGIRYRVQRAWVTDEGRIAPQALAECIVDAVVEFGDCLQGGLNGGLCHLTLGTEMTLCVLDEERRP